MLFNGFGPEEDLAPWRRLLDGLEHEEQRLERRVLDLAAYREATERVQAQRYCFINSYTVVLVENWLAMPERALSAPGVGLVGASGSWGSLRSYNRFMLGFGGPYARVFSDRKAANATLAAVAAQHSTEEASSQERPKRAPLKFARALLESSHGFTPFPAPHIRTNGFMIRRDVFSRLRISPPQRKGDAYRLESGRDSITAQVKRLGLAARVVDRDGRAYDPPDWYASKTLWQGNQERLLIADNQTADYELGDLDMRAALSRYAWGAKSDFATDRSRRQAGA
jgi:hypothetical protein